MSQENDEIVRRTYDAFQRGDVETALAPMGEAFVLEEAPGRRACIGGPLASRNSVPRPVFQW